MILRMAFLTGMLLIKTQQNMNVITPHLFDARFVVSAFKLLRHELPHHKIKTVTQTNRKQDGFL